MNIKSIFESLLEEGSLKDLDREAVADVKAEIEELWDASHSDVDQFKKAVKEKKDWPVDWQDVYKFAKTHIKDLKEELSQTIKDEIQNCREHIKQNNEQIKKLAHRTDESDVNETKKLKDHNKKLREKIQSLQSWQ
jgi:gas vesicle protein